MKDKLFKKYKEKHNRSDSYQQIYNETLKLEHWQLAYFSNDYKIGSEQLSQEYLELRDELAHAILKLAKEILSEINYTILVLFMEGYTQSEIAGQIGLSQGEVCRRFLGAATSKIYIDLYPQIVQYYEGGLTFEKIAKLIHLHEATVRSIYHNGGERKRIKTDTVLTNV